MDLSFLLHLGQMLSNGAFRVGGSAYKASLLPRECPNAYIAQRDTHILQGSSFHVPQPKESRIAHQRHGVGVGVGVGSQVQSGRGFFTLNTCGEDRNTADVWPVMQLEVLEPYLLI